MVIEQLKFQIPIESQEEFLQKDAEIWTPLLYSFAGFRNKKIYITPDRPTEIIIIIQWESKKHWESISKGLITKTIKYFEQEMLKAKIIASKPIDVKIYYVNE